jgi:copper(I)-binding protein
MIRRAIRSRAAVTGLLAATAVLTGCGPSSSSAVSPTYDEPVLKVTGAYIPQPSTAGMAAGYFTVTNSGLQPGTLTGVTSDIATTATMDHTTASGRKQQVQQFTVPAGGALVLRSGGDQLMLTGLKNRLRLGESVTLHLRFAASDSITVRAPVKPATYEPSH